MKSFVILLLLLCARFAAAQAPPATVTRTLTNGSTSLTVEFSLHPIRSSNYEVQVQDSTGAFTPYTADVPRTYIGTVAARPGAIAAGYQKANGTFWSYIIFEDGTTWSSSGTTASAGGNANWTPNVYPTSGVGPGGAGSSVRAAELAIDASYREWQAVGSDLVNAIDMIEFCTMKANIVYLRDAAILHRLGRIVIRTDAAKCPYQAMPSSTTSDWSALLNKIKSEWNSVLPPVLGASAHDVASLIRPGVGGGLAWVGAIGTSNRYNITGASSSGDFLSAWRHELGHNWGSSHYEGGGKPEGPTIMSDNSLARFSSSELAKMINHRNSKSGILDNLGAYSFPLPPRVFGDRVTMSAGSLSTLTDVLVNDSDSNGEAVSLLSTDSASAKRALVVLSPGTGPSGRDQILYYAPPNYSSGYDHYNYRIQDSAGYQAVGKVYVNPAPLLPLPPLWTSSDIGATGAAGDAGAEGGTYVVYGAGSDIWGTADEFRYVRQTANGDCDLRARVTGQSNTNGYAKAGVMLRESTAANAAHASLYITPSNGFSFQYRSATGGTTTNVNGPALNPGMNNWVRMTRSGNVFTSYVSADGIAWTQVGTTTIPMGASIQAGMAVTSHVDATPGGAAFDRVSLSHEEPFATLLEDRFEGGTPGDDASEPLDAAWSSNSTLTVANDAALGGGPALNVDGNTYAGIDTGFAGRTLANPGDLLKLSFDFRYTQTPGNNSGGFRFGLFNSSGDGYSIQNGTGGSGYFALMKDGGSDGSFGFGGLTALATSSKASLNDQAKHTAVLLLKKTAAGMEISAEVDGIAISATDNSPVSPAFDILNLSNGNITGDYRVDNLRVEAFQLAPPAFAGNPFTKATAAIGLAYSGTLADHVTVPHPGNSYSKTGGPSWLAVAADGTLSGTPAAGDAGPNSFGVRVTNENGISADAVMEIPVAYAVTVAVTDAGASEEDLSPGEFTLTRSGPTGSDLTVHYTLGGSAQAGADYVSPGTSAVIPAGQAGVSIPIVPLDDALLEPAETVVLTLAPSSAYAAGTSGSGTVTISDDESLFVRMNDGFDSPNASPGNDGDDPFDSAWIGTSATLTVAEDGTLGGGKALNVDTTASFAGTRGSFAARSLPANGDALTLSFDFRYTAAPANIGAGLRFGLYNASGEGYCVHHGTGGNQGFSLVESPAGAFGSGTTSTFQSGSKASLADQAKHSMALTLRKTAAGITATATVDGVSLSGSEATPVITTFDSVFIANGNQNTDFRVDKVRVEFSPNLPPAFPAGPPVKSAVIGLPFSATLAADAADPNSGDTFTFAKISGPSWLTVAANGTLGGTPSAGDAGANLFTIRLTDNHGASADLSLTVNVGHPVSIQAAAPFAREAGAQPGAFAISRGGPLASALTVHLTLGGSAAPGTDYTAPALTAVIPPGESSVLIPLAPLDDGEFEADETVIATLAPDAAYAVSEPSAATVTILDDEVLRENLADTFDIGASPGPGDDGDDPLDAAWTGTAASLSVAEDSALDSGKALKVNATGTFTLARANFPAAALAQVGDKLRLSFDFRYTEAAPATGSGLRFGLYNAAGDGFLVQHGIGGTGGWALAEDTAGDGGFGSGGTVSGLTSGSRTSVNGLVKHEFALTLVKTAAGIAVTGEANGSQLSFTDTTPVITSFEAVGIRHGNLTADFAVDNVRVEFTRNLAPYFTALQLGKPAATIGEAYLESLLADAADPNEGDIFTFAKISGPAWLSVAADGTLTGTPDAADDGPNHFTVRVTDQHGTYSEGSLTVEVTGSQAPLEAWREARFGSESGDPAIAGDTADPDGDGVVNLIEYAFGTDPRVSGPAPVPSVAGGELSIIYTRDLSATDVTVTPLWSENLEEWHESGITVTTLGEEGLIRTLKASLPAGSAARFLRVKVE